MTDHEGDANTRDLCKMWRDYSIDKFYYRFHGRGDGITEPQPPSQPKPHELQAFIDAIKTRFRTSSAEYLIELDNMVCSPTDTVSSIYAKFNDAASVIEGSNAMTSEQLALRLLQLISLPIQYHIKKWCFDTNKQRFFANPREAPLTRKEIMTETNEIELYMAK